MMLQKKYSFLVMLLVALLVVGCVESNHITVPSPWEAPTDGSTSTLMPVITSTPTSFLTPTGVPTLALDEARIRLLSFLGNNGNCRLPCLWGITPGTSSSQNAQVILAPLSGLSDFTVLNSESGKISPNYIEEGDLTISIRVGYLANSDNYIVSRISFDARALKAISFGFEDVFDSTIFGDQVPAYLLPHILSEQGIPAAVLISTLAEHPTRGVQAGFDMLLFYPDQGILVHYTTSWQISTGNVLGCFSNAHVALELFPSGRGYSFSEFLAPTEWADMWPVPIDNPYWRPIETATSMSLEEFYQTFRQPTDQCIETPASLWPVPER